MEETNKRVEIIWAVAGRLASFLTALPQEQWSAASRCDLWEVADVVSHLAGGAERQAESMRRGRQGISESPPGFTAVDSPTMSANNAQRDIERRQHLGSGLLDAFVANHAQLHNLLTAFGPAEWETPCWHARRGAIPARDYVDLRLQELVIHDWDIRAALAPGAHLDQEGAQSLIPVGQTWLAMTFRPGTKLEQPVTFRFDVKGQPRACHDVISDGETFQIGPQSTAAADVTISCDGDSYLLYAYGRLSAAAGKDPGTLSITGNANLMESFEQWFKGL
jgi:uncharacterized protein (TIGR03083 family)